MRSGLLDVGGGHLIYYEEHGDADGLPVVVLHGGPGGGLERWVLELFDLRRWRVFLFDQRGCGKSQPRLEVRNNTTWDLVSDIERLRERVAGVEKWWVFGGSWGSTLSLAYASRHLKHVSGLVLRGIYMGEPWMNQWMYEEGGVSRLRPTEWAAFAGRQRHGSVFKTYRRLLANRRTRRAAAKRWSQWESALSTLEPRGDEKMPARQAEEMAVLESHYFAHNCWISPNKLLVAARRIPKSVPVWIVQGRYDLVCPAASAISLKQAVPHAHLLLTMAGHSAREPKNYKALKQIVKHAATA